VGGRSIPAHVRVVACPIRAPIYAAIVHPRGSDIGKAQGCSETDSATVGCLVHTRLPLDSVSDFLDSRCCGFHSDQTAN
jgi:hypothetical protein